MTDEILIERICRRLHICDPRCIEIESKRRIVPDDIERLKSQLKQAGARPIKSSTFFDQFLDTPTVEILKAGASLRLRYKGGGAKVYLQYKGPGFHRDGVLYRSEFSSTRLKNVLREESHHDVVHFTQTSVREILRAQIDPPMHEALRRHLGDTILSRISRGPILCMYQKEKFAVDLRAAFLEPSVDRVFAFHVNPRGLHALSTFCEYENEIKSENEDILAKLQHVPDLLIFDLRLASRIDMPVERLDKYRRCASCIL